VADSLPAVPYPVTTAANSVPASFSPSVPHGYICCGSFGFPHFHAMNPLDSPAHLSRKLFLQQTFAVWPTTLIY
jgi:hypothetical protein